MTPVQQFHSDTGNASSAFTVSTTVDDPGAFDRFEALAKRLVKVPKKELDEARNREQARPASG